MNELPNTAKEAKVQGIQYYFTGGPCKHGHISTRLTSNHYCTECKRGNPNQHAVQRKWHRTHKSVDGSQSAQWYASHPEKRKQIEQRKYKKRLATGHFRKWSALRRARVRQATVSWSDAQKIQHIYEECQRLEIATGIKHQVDHIVPLKGELVCGLHCEYNLQILTADANKKKHNHFTI